MNAQEPLSGAAPGNETLPPDQELMAALLSLHEIIGEHVKSFLPDNWQEVVETVQASTIDP